MDFNKIQNKLKEGSGDTTSSLNYDVLNIATEIAHQLTESSGDPIAALIESGLVDKSYDQLPIKTKSNEQVIKETTALALAKANDDHRFKYYLAAKELMESYMIEMLSDDEETIDAHLTEVKKRLSQCVPQE